MFYTAQAGLLMGCQRDSSDAVTRRQLRPLQGRPASTTPGPRPALPLLSASEIGAFSFCPEAWYLQRRGVARNDLAEARLAAGTHAHRRLAQRTDRLQLAATLERVLLSGIVLLIAWFAVQLLGVPGLVP